MAPTRDTRWPMLVTLLLSTALTSAEGATTPGDSQRLTALLQPAASTTSTSTSSSSTDATINRCREACLAKHSVPDMTCGQTRACSMCWNSCSNSGMAPTPPTPRKSSLNRCQLQLTIQRMVRNESLVTADVSWTPDLADICNGTNFGTPSSSQCLVTWEVSGGGLMGNLLTESSSVQLSLWSDTNYRVQVTCRSKQTSFLIRSAPLVLSTSGAVILDGRKPPAKFLNEVAEGDDDEALARELDSSEEVDATGHREHPSTRQHPWPVAHDGESEIAILALFVTMLLFLLVLLTIVILVKWRPVTADPERLEKDVLVENDVMVEILHV